MSNDRSTTMSGKLFDPPRMRQDRYQRETDAPAASPAETPTLRDRLLLIFVVVFTCGAWILQGGRQAENGSSTLTNAVFALAELLAFVGIWKKRDAVGRLLRASRPLVLLFLLAVLSTLWSDQHLVTLRRSVELLGWSAIGLYFACRLGMRGFVETLSVAIGVTAVLSFAMLIIAPGYSLSPETDAWAAFFSHKNTLGPAMVLGIITVFCLLDRMKGTRRFIGIAALIAFVILLIGSKNGAGVGMAALLTLVVPFLLWARKKRLSKSGFVVAAIVVAVSFAILALGLGLDAVFGVVGKDATLTGRTDLWALVIDAIRQKPLLGYGYSAFWAGPDSDATRLIYPYIYWTPGMAHNGLLELGLNLGILGDGLLVVALVAGFRKASALFWNGHDWLSAWPLLFMLYLVMTNISGATFLRYSELDWLAFMAAFAMATDRYGLRESHEPRSKPFSPVFAAGRIGQS